MDQDKTWYGGRPRPRAPSPNFGLCLLWPNCRPSQQLLSSCMNIMFILNVLSGMKTSGGKKSLCHLSPQVHFQNKSCTTIGAWRYASLTSTTKVGSELPAWLLLAPCQVRTGRCKHFESRWIVASLGVLSSYAAVAQTEFDWHQSTHSFERHVQTESRWYLMAEESGGC